MFVCVCLFFARLICLCGLFVNYYVMLCNLACVVFFAFVCVVVVSCVCLCVTYYVMSYAFCVFFCAVIVRVVSHDF